jgi:hypothetical protein
VSGDAFKLFERFNTDENNGVAGAFITLIVYLAEFLVAGFCLYNYLIYVHMNGKPILQSLTSTTSGKSVQLLISIRISDCISTNDVWGVNACRTDA